MEPFRVVGIYSPAPQSGKTTAAKYLQNSLGLVPLSFATPVKSLALRLLFHFFTGDGGLNEAYQWASTYFQNKERPIEELPGAPTMRNVLESIGADLRSSLHGDLWLAVAKLEVERVRSDGVGSDQRKAVTGVVFDDVRYPNEAEFIKSLGGFMVQLILPGAAAVPGAKAEGLLNGFPFDAVVMNIGSKGDLFRAVTTKVAELLVAPKGLPSVHAPE